MDLMKNQKNPDCVCEKPCNCGSCACGGKKK
jgi:hypothetical protein